MKKGIFTAVFLFISMVTFGQQWFPNGIVLPNAQENTATDSVLVINGDGEVQYSGANNLTNSLYRSTVNLSSPTNTRNDQSTIIRLDDGRLAIAYSHFGDNSQDVAESSIYVQFSDDSGKTWSTPQELIPKILLGSYIPSFYKKPNGDVLCVFFVREQATQPFLSSIRKIVFSADLSTVVVPQSIVLSATDYHPIAPNRLYNDEGRLLMPYPVLISGGGGSTGSVYHTRLLISNDEGVTWNDAGIEINGFLNIDGVGGAVEPGVVKNKDKITIYSRNITGKIGAVDLTWSGTAYTLGAEYKLDIQAINAQSSIEYVKELRGWVAAYTRLNDSPTGTRAQIDVSFSTDFENWSKVFTVDDIEQVGGTMVNEPIIYIGNDKIHIAYSVAPTSGRYDLKTVVLPFSFFSLGQEKNRNYTTNPTTGTNLFVSDYFLTPSFQDKVFGAINRTYVTINDDVILTDAVKPTSFYSTISGLYIDNTNAVQKKLSIDYIPNLSTQMVVDNVDIDNSLSQIYVNPIQLTDSNINELNGITIRNLVSSSSVNYTVGKKFAITQLGDNDVNYFNGNVGLNTDTPDYPLDVVGQIRAENLVSAVDSNFIAIPNITLAADVTSDFNNLETAGYYNRLLRYNNLNAPPAVAVSYFYLLVLKANNDQLTQIAIPYRQPSENIYFRIKNSGVYGSWRKLWDSSNFSQSDIDNWNTALQTETDPLFSASAANGLLLHEQTITSTELTNSGTTPVDLIASPGVGKIIVIEKIVAFLDFQTAQWTPTTDAAIKYGSGELISGLPVQQILGSTSDYYHVAEISDNIVPNQKVVIGFASNPTAGDSPLHLKIYYRIEEF